MDDVEFAKHTVHTDALETLGKLIDEHQGRDAIHLAVEPVLAGQQLFAGTHVGVVCVNGQMVAYHELEGSPLKHVGVVDPFLETAVEPEQRFWLVVYPRVITSLRHVWTHPDFPNLAADLGPTDEQKAASKKWIEEYVAELNEDFDPEYDYGGKITVNELIEKAKTWCDGSKWGDHVSHGGLLEGVATKPEFWKHYKVLTGMEPSDPEDKTPSFFSCSC